MAERSHALAALSGRAAAIAPCPPASRFILRLLPGSVAAAGAAFGVALPEAACRAAAAAGRAALWLGPDEWLLIAPETEGEAVAAALERALDGTPHALVEISQRNVGLELSGPGAATTLAAGCPLDLDAAAFPPGMCTRTLLGKAEIVLWRTGLETWRVEVQRSFAAYAWKLLEQARRDWCG